MHILRTKFGKDIIAEFLPPTRTTKKARVIILCPGMPGSPSKKEVIEFFSRKGYWVFSPRYKGTWESSGKFLAQSPHLDIKVIIDQLPKGFKDIWSNKIHEIKPSAIYLFGFSFGGPAAILNSSNKKVTKIIAFSPVIDWRVEGKDESIDILKRFVAQGFGRAFAVAKDGWKKLQSGKFYNPATQLTQIDASKILIVHAKDDRIVPYSTSKQFAQKTGATLITLERGGHLSSSLAITPRYYKIFQNCIKSGKVS